MPTFEGEQLWICSLCGEPRVTVNADEPPVCHKVEAHDNHKAVTLTLTTAEVRRQVPGEADPRNLLDRLRSRRSVI